MQSRKLNLSVGDVQMIAGVTRSSRFQYLSDLAASTPLVSPRLHLSHLYSFLFNSPQLTFRIIQFLFTFSSRLGSESHNSTTSAIFSTDFHLDSTLLNLTQLISTRFASIQLNLLCHPKSFSFFYSTRRASLRLYAIPLYAARLNSTFTYPSISCPNHISFRLHSTRRHAARLCSTQVVSTRLLSSQLPIFPPISPIATVFPSSHLPSTRLTSARLTSFLLDSTHQSIA
jgi:hypothetical protein